MRYDKLTVKAQEIIQDSETLTHKYNNAAIEPEHILYSLLSQQDGIVPPLTDKLGVSREQILADLSAALNNKPKIYGDNAQIQLSPETAKILNRAEIEADKLKDEYISTEHIFVGHQR